MSNFKITELGGPTEYAVLQQEKAIRKDERRKALSDFNNYLYWKDFIIAKANVSSINKNTTYYTTKPVTKLSRKFKDLKKKIVSFFTKETKLYPAVSGRYHKLDSYSESRMRSHTFGNWFLT